MYFYEGSFHCFLDCKDSKEVMKRLDLVMQNALFLKRYRDMEYIDFYHMYILEEKWKDDEGMFDEFVGFPLHMDYVLVSQLKVNLDLVKDEMKDALKLYLKPTKWSNFDIIDCSRNGKQDENITKDAAWYLKSKYGFEK